MRPAESEVFGAEKFLSDEQIIYQILTRATPKTIPTSYGFDESNPYISEDEGIVTDVIASGPDPE